MRPLAAALFTAIIVSAAFSQKPSEIHSRLIADLASGKTAAVVEALAAFRSNDPKAFLSNNYDYLLARLYEDSGDTERAAPLYHSVRSRGSRLRGYAAWHLSQIARRSGNLVLERMLLMEMLAETPASLLSDTANRRLAESYFDSGDLVAVETAVTGAVSAGSGKPSRDLQMLLAGSFLLRGDADSARRLFNEIVSAAADIERPDDLSLEAVTGLDRISQGDAPTLITDAEHLRRGKVYQYNRAFAKAREHFIAIVNEFPDSNATPEALYLIGRGHTQTSDFTEAVKWYERLAEQFPQDPINADATLQLASAYARLGRRRESVSRYERFIAVYPDNARLDRAYLNIIDVLRDAGEETEAIERAKRTQEVFRGKAAEAQALFVQSRIRIAGSDWGGALSDLERLQGLKDLGGTSVPGGTTEYEVKLLRGFVLEQLQRFPEAIEIYLSIPDGRNAYHGQIATERLRDMASAERSASDISQVAARLRAAAAGDTEGERLRLQALYRLEPDGERRARILDALKAVYSRSQDARPILTTESKPVTRKRATVADELLYLGLYDEAAPEFEAAERKAKDAKDLTPEAEFTFARYYSMGGRADRALAWAERNANIRGDHLPELLPPDLASLLYPAPYKQPLMEYAPERNVDPRFVLSIMRQESGFKPTARSSAAARGLMQFISDTSERIAARLGRGDFAQTELYRPRTAILFGSEYIRELFTLFPNQPEAVAASYNGGEDNMKRWYGRARSDLPIRYVTEIAFAQSKDYVWRVMANYRMYQLLYDEKLNRK